MKIKKNLVAQPTFGQRQRNLRRKTEHPVPKHKVHFKRNEMTSCDKCIDVKINERQEETLGLKKEQVHKHKSGKAYLSHT